MKILISGEDRDIMEHLIEALSPYGMCDIATEGQQSIDAFMLSLTENDPYDIICLDVMSLKTDGLKILRVIREKEASLGIDRAKIIFTSNASGIETVFNAFASKDEVYTSGILDKDSVKQIIENNWPDKLNIDKPYNL